MEGNELDRLKKIRQEWETDLEKRGVQERKKEFFTRSRIPVKRVYTPIDLEETGFDYVKGSQFPGGISLYTGGGAVDVRESLWLIGQYGGFGSPEETNQRFKYLLSQGITAYHHAGSSNPDGLRLRSSHGERGGWKDGGCGRLTSRHRGHF